MQVQLDRGSREGGQNRRIGEDLAVLHHFDLGVSRVQPRGRLTVRDDEQLVNPGRILLQRPERVLQILVVPHPVGRRILLRLLRFKVAIAPSPLQPGGVAAICPNVHRVDNGVAQTVAVGAMSDVVSVRPGAIVRARQRRLSRVHPHHERHSRKHAGESDQENEGSMCNGRKSICDIT